MSTHHIPGASVKTTVDGTQQIYEESETINGELRTSFILRIPDARGKLRKWVVSYHGEVTNEVREQAHRNLREATSQ